MSNEVISNSNAITLSWNSIAGATLYHIQVSKTYLDFRATLLIDDNALASSTKSFTATGNGIYYWRYKAYVSSVWQDWKEVNSFIVNTSASADVSVTGWTLINKTDVSDFYLLENQPISQPIQTPEHLWEAYRRTRDGSLVTEQYATKTRLSLDISRGYLGDNQKAEIMRFYNAHTSFYLATRYDNQTMADFVYRIWEMMFTNIPQLDIPGGNTLEFEEI